MKPNFLPTSEKRWAKKELCECGDADLSRTLEELSGGKYNNWWIFTDINGYRVETCQLDELNAADFRDEAGGYDANS